MKKPLTFLLFILIAQAGLGQLEYSGLLIADELKADANAVILSKEVDFKVRSDKSAIKRTKEIITILNPKGDKFATFLIVYDNFRKPGCFRGTIYDSWGNRIKKLDKDDLKDESYNSGSLYEDNRMIYYEPLITKYPYTVSYEYEVVYNSLLFFPIWQAQPSYNISVKKSVFKVIAPEDYSFRYKELNVNEPVQISSSKSDKIYTWYEHDLPAIKKEPLGPYISEITPTVYTGPGTFIISGMKGNMESWEGFGSWIQQLNEGRTGLSESTISDIRKIADGSTSPAESIKKIYEYMQSRTRYVSVQLGIGGWQAEKASVVDEVGYGDCKALSNYMMSLLKAANIRSCYTLVKAGDDVSDIQADFPCLQFNHVIVSVPLQEDTIWLECTSQDNPCGYLGDFTGDRYVLTVDMDGSKIARTPALSKHDNTQIRIAEVELNDLGEGVAKVTTEYSGWQYDHIQNILSESREEQKKWIYGDKDIPGFEIKNFSFEDNKAQIPSAKETLNLALINYASRSGKRYFLPLNLMNKLERLPKNTKERKQDIVLRYAFVDIDTIYYYLPPSLEIEYQPEDVTANSEFGTYHSSVNSSEDTIRYIRHLEINKGRYTPDKYPQLLEFYTTIVKADKAKMVLIESDGAIGTEGLEGLRD